MKRIWVAPILVVLPMIIGCATASRSASELFEIRLAKDEPTPGYTRRVIHNRNETVYISPTVEVNDMDIKKASPLKLSFVAIASPKAQNKEQERITYGLMITLKYFAGRRLAKVTGMDEHLGDRLAIIVRNKVMDAPEINGPVGRRFFVSSDYTEAEAMQLARNLNREPEGQ